jgi:glycerol uptake facilitator-like aquaporin
MSSNPTTHKRKINFNKGERMDVSAESRQELLQQGVPENGASSYVSRLFSFSGMYQSPTWSAALWAFLWEMTGSFLIGISVGTAAFMVSGLHTVLAAAGVASAYAVSYYLGTRLPADYSLRRHLNWAITVAYAVTTRIGLGGALFYAVAQFFGSLLAGGFLAGVLVPRTVAIPVVQATIPLPTTDITSLLTVCLLELFGAAILVLILLSTEFAGTVERKAVKNFRKATKNVALATFALVLLGYAVAQTFTFSNVAYFGPLFGNAANSVAGRHLSDLASLYDTTLYPTSVFGPATIANPTAAGSGLAWMLYMFMPIVGGLLGSVLFLAFFMGRFSETAAMHEQIPDNKKRDPVSLDGQGVEGHKLRNADVQSQASGLVSPFHKTA